LFIFEITSRCLALSIPYRQACLGVGKEWIRRLLADMKERGESAVQVREPADRWRYVRMSTEGTTST
jgi:hypothetical protein